MRLTFFEVLGKSRKIEKFLTFENGVKGTLFYRGLEPRKISLQRLSRVRNSNSSLVCQNFEIDSLVRIHGSMTLELKNRKN